MSNGSSVARIAQLSDELTQLVASLKDQEFMSVWETEATIRLLTAIQDPNDRENFEKVGDYLLARKHRLTALARLRRTLNELYPVRVKKDGETHIISVLEYQWFDDAVLFVEGSKPYEGRIGKYDGTEVSYAVAARYIGSGEAVGPNDLDFIPLEQARARIEQIQASAAAGLDAPLRDLDALLAAQDNAEADYQQLLNEYPWSLGLRWSAVRRHEHLDDQNIPDFTGLRVDRDVHDIIEIKPPFTPMFREDGDFAAPFNKAWNQCERYLDFVDREPGYLSRQKGLEFENARCYLIIGYSLSSDELEKFRRKERMNPRIEIRTYDDIRVWMQSTLKFIEEQAGGSFSAPAS